MLDRAVVEEFLEEKFKEDKMKVPQDIKMTDLVETFCLYIEDDYYQWLKDNFKSFFGSLDWDWIRGRIGHYKKEYNF